MHPSAISAELIDGSVLLHLDDGSNYELPNLWLRDNCPCDDCRVVQTQEKRFIVSDIDVQLAPRAVSVTQNTLSISWPDHHQSLFSIPKLQSLSRSSGCHYKVWPHGFVPQSFSWDAFLKSPSVAIDALESFMQFGVILLTQAPIEPETLEQLAPIIGPIRELLFDRIHDVSVEGHVYNIAHTALELPPHNDFASYSFPPSVQALHMLRNDVVGGDSIVVDGWAILDQLRSDRPEYFRILSEFPVAFRQFDDENETYAVAPLVGCDSRGDIVSLRYSNQLMQMMDPLQPGVKEFYLAYHELCVRITDTNQAYRSTFRLHGGQVILVAAHRVLHARESFQPTAQRHLQDAYFELDNIANKLILMKRQREL